jgi:hypothetical protein
MVLDHGKGMLLYQNVVYLSSVWNMDGDAAIAV